MFIERADAFDELDPDGKLAVRAGLPRSAKQFGWIFIQGAFEVGAIDEKPDPLPSQFGQRRRFLFQDGVRLRKAGEARERFGLEQEEIPMPRGFRVVPTRGSELCFPECGGIIAPLVCGYCVLVGALRPSAGNRDAEECECCEPLRA